MKIHDNRVDRGTMILKDCQNGSVIDYNGKIYLVTKWSQFGHRRIVNLSSGEDYDVLETTLVVLLYAELHICSVSC